ncbi:MAG: DUF885 domain-containing protein [Myxococcales bacterium]|nr:DUF885 domain-containing protein [Myxococcales bacterium]
MSAPQDPFRFSEALVDDVAARRPMQATFMGVAGHDDRWDDLSPEGAAEVDRALRDWSARLSALPVGDGEDRWSRLARVVMRDWLDQELASHEHGDHEVDLNHIASPIQSAQMVFDSMDTSSAQGWTAVASRLEGLGALLGGYRRTLEKGLAAGQVVAERQVRAAAAQCRAHAGADSSFRAMPSAMERAGVDDAALARRLERAVPGACEAFGALGAWLQESYLPRARREDGVGRERYLRAMRRFLGAVPDPEETYAWGWTEVAKILEQMRAVAAQIAPGKSLDEVIALMRTDPARAAHDRETFLAAMRDRQARALAALDGAHFDVPDVIRHVDVKEAPPGGPLGAYYVPPSEDFSRRGAICYQLAGDGPYPLWDEVSTAYHEGFPGHHLQCGLQVSFTESLCRLHRVAYGYSGFAEGWALYVEQLMSELGYYDKPDYELGMLANQMMRACRVVIDIGAHLSLPIPDGACFRPGERWTYDVAVEMMERLGGMEHDTALSEVTRYFGWPGQAISYKVGQRAMLALREEHQRAKLGDLKDFHARVLACGNVSLDLLRGEVLGS